MLLIIIFINSVKSLTINTVPCTCPQLLSQIDCERQTSALGCSWDSDAEQCIRQDCQSITDLEECNKISFCAWTSIATCTYFYKAICPYFNSTSLGGDCINKQCQNNQTKVNEDNSYRCQTVLHNYTEIKCGNQADESSCDELMLCNWNSTANLCIDNACSDYPTTLCTVSFNTSSLPINSTPCQEINGVCATLDHIYNLDSANCNKNTLNTYTWNPSAVQCQICNIYGDIISAVMIFIFLY